jgi:hypothetical protein
MMSLTALSGFLMMESINSKTAPLVSLVLSGGKTVPKKGALPVTKSIPAFIAPTQFGQIFERVSPTRKRFLVTKKGEAKAVILRIEGFFQAVVKIPKSLATLQEQAKGSGADHQSS